MTNEEKVLAVWPDAREVQLRRGKWLIAHGNDPERPGYSILGPEFASTEAAWQNAAESLPAQPEQELCPYCRETKDKCLSNEYCYSTHWEVAPVEAKEKERCTSCNAILPHKRFSRCWKSRVAEPKPTPSTQSNETFEDVRRSLSAAHNLINNWHDINYGTRAVEAQDIICEAITSIMRLESPKPQPDSSSISTEQTFEEWWNSQGRLFMAGDDIHVQRTVMGVCERAWAAAKGQSNGR